MLVDMFGMPIEKPEFSNDEKGFQVTVEKFRTTKDKELTMKAGDILRKTYKGYGWFVRAIGGKNDPTGLGIGLAELVRWFGTQSVYYFNPMDKEFIDNEMFEKKVKQIGGELLERARLCRGESRDESITKVPDGYEQFIPPKPSLNEVHSVEEFVQWYKRKEKEKVG